MIRRNRRWVCPNCDVTAYTRPVPNRYHGCRGLNGVLAPMVPEGSDCKVVAHEREDYIGADRVLLDANGRPMMNVETVWDHGNDVAVFAPVATVAAQ